MRLGLCFWSCVQKREIALVFSNRFFAQPLCQHLDGPPLSITFRTRNETKKSTNQWDRAVSVYWYYLSIQNEWTRYWNCNLPYLTNKSKSLSWEKTSGVDTYFCEMDVGLHRDLNPYALVNWQTQKLTSPCYKPFVPFPGKFRIWQIVLLQYRGDYQSLVGLLRMSETEKKLPSCHVVL